MSFPLFTGVNHQLQSILFEDALLEDECWRRSFCCSQFRRCMFDRPTTAIITDHDAAICKAIGMVFQGSRHWYYMWYVRKHELEHLQGYRAHLPNTKDGCEEIHSSGFKRCGIIYCRNSMLRRGTGSAGCTITWTLDSVLQRHLLGWYDHGW